MRILVTSIVDPQRSAHSRLHEFASHLSRSHELTIISVRDPWKDRQHSSRVHHSEFNETLPGVRLIHLTDSDTSIAGQELFSGRRIRNLLASGSEGQFDLIIDYNTIYTGWRASSNLPGIPRIYDLADDIADMVRHSRQLPPVLRNLASRKVYSLLRRTVRSASFVTCTTERLVKKYDAQPEKSIILPNGVPSSFLQNHSHGHEIELRMRKDEFLLCYVGVLREWVDFEPVMVALSQLNKHRPARLVVVGEEGGIQSLREAARAHRVEDLVTLVGTVPYDRVRDYLCGCDCGLIPFAMSEASRMSVPLKAFEYFSCGLPVLSTSIPAMENIFRDEVLFYNGDSEILCRELLDLADNPDLGRERVTRARMKIEKDFTWEAILQRLDSLIERVAS